MKSGFMFAALIALFAYFEPVSAQYEVGGILDIVARNRSADDYSNKTFKQHSNFDFIRARLFFDAAVSERTTIFTQVLIDNDRFHLYGAYARLSRIAGKNLNLHAGYIPNTVGLWGPRTYSDKNPLIGVPLVYIYHTALNPGSDQITKQQLLAHRGLGFDHYGWPILYDACWNTGLDFFGAIGKFDWSIAALSGTLSAPSIQPEKDIPQFTSKLTYYASPALSISVSGFLGPYLNEIPVAEPADAGYGKSSLSAADVSPEDYLNYGGGLGVHFEVGYVDLYSEGFWTRWEHPYFGNLDAYSGYVDLRYKLGPQWYVAGRAEAIGFSELDFGGSAGRLNWDYPLNRIEFGVGYRLDHSTTLKAVSQIVRCPDFDFLDDEIVSLQLSVAVH